MEELDDPINCKTAEGDIRRLQQEKTHVAEQILAGVTAITPAGIVIGAVTGTGETKFKVGDRVISNGSHAEVVCVPKNLCAKVPDSVTDEQATFTVIGAIGLQSIRLAAPTLGEKFVVFGTGLIGLMTVQLLLSCGCNVMAVDIDENRLGVLYKEMFIQ